MDSTQWKKRFVKDLITLIVSTELHSWGEKKCTKYNDGLHNISGPAEIGFYIGGDKSYELYCLDGELHDHYFGSKIKPAYTKWFPDGSKYYETHYSNGKKHNAYITTKNGLRKEKPAYREWYTDDTKVCKEYYINGKLHNHYAPYFDNDGELCYKEKPARIVWGPDGSVLHKQYYLDGVLVKSE